MGFIRWIVYFLNAVVLITLGILLVAYEKKDIYDMFDQVYQQFLGRVPEGIPYRQLFGAFIALVGIGFFVTLFSGRRKPRTVSFAGTHGDVTISLEPVEATLERVATKLPEVRNIDVQLRQMEGQGRVKVNADAVLVKNADDDARLITARVNNYLQVHTRKILGLQDVEVALTVRRFVMNMKSVKPEPLMLEGPAGVAAEDKRAKPEAGAEVDAVSAELMDSELEIDRSDSSRA
jgi:hypothetical protein